LFGAAENVRVEAWSRPMRDKWSGLEPVALVGTNGKLGVVQLGEQTRQLAQGFERWVQLGHLSPMFVHPVLAALGAGQARPVLTDQFIDRGLIAMVVHKHAERVRRRNECVTQARESGPDLFVDSDIDRNSVMMWPPHANM